MITPPRALLLASLLATSTALAADPPPPRERGNRSPFEINLAVDISISVAAGVTAGSLTLLAGDLIRDRCAPDCSTNDINELDRTVIGNHDPAADIASDIIMATTLVLPFIFNAIDVAVSDPSDGWAGYGRDTVVLLETAAITTFVNTVITFAIQRPRPLVYDETRSMEDRRLAQSYLSFFSGHTAGSFAMATAYGYLFWKRHPESPWVAPVWVGMYALAGTQAYLRVHAGDHFWTDIIVGAVIGTAIGVAVPAIHLRDDQSASNASFLGSRLVLMPWAGGGGFGFGVSLR